MNTLKHESICSSKYTALALTQGSQWLGRAGPVKLDGVVQRYCLLNSKGGIMQGTGKPLDDLQEGLMDLMGECNFATAPCYQL